MTRVVSRITSGMAALCAGSAALGAQPRCLATEYHLPAAIAEDLRPYLICGLIHERSDTGTTLNGISVLMNGQGPEACANLRTKAFAAAHRRLETVIPDVGSRQNYLVRELIKADEFLIAARRLDEFSIGDEPDAKPCNSTTPGENQ